MIFKIKRTSHHGDYEKSPHPAAVFKQTKDIYENPWQIEIKDVQQITNLAIREPIVISNDGEFFTLEIYDDWRE
jgi:hypothetical protein